MARLSRQVAKERIAEAVDEVLEDMLIRDGLVPDQEVVVNEVTDAVMGVLSELDDEDIAETDLSGDELNG